MSEAALTRVVGALAEAEPLGDASLYERVRVGRRGLLGEVIRVSGDRATIQILEETAGLALGDPVVRSGAPLTAQLGPGLLGAVLDGVGRPLPALAEKSGAFLEPGGDVPTLEAARRWRFEPARRSGERVAGGDVLGTVEEQAGFVHRVLLPPDCAGTIAAIEAGEFGVEEPFGALEDETPLRLAQHWPVRRARPAGAWLAMDRPLVTGQRIFDLLFPVAEGGTVAVPGGFGTGKTVIEQSLAKFAAADIVVFVGCGERGNEMADVLTELPELTDPRSGRSLMERAILVVNTSNMPVAAREASVYLGMTLAEYYRDMGHRVAVLADSLSRWAEALREIGSRLQEMPGEEGYPTYLTSRLARLFERAGRVRCLGSPERAGAVTLVGAVSPPGGDFSEPVTQATLRVSGALWALDAGLAHQRQFPAVDWATSYSLYAERTAPWFGEHGGEGWKQVRTDLLELLQREQDLREIASLAGPESLEDRDRLALEVARLARQLVLGQNVFDPKDASSPVAKTFALATLVRDWHQDAERAVQAGRAVAELDFEAVRRALRGVREAAEEELATRVAETRARLRALAGIEQEEPT